MPSLLRITPMASAVRWLARTLSALILLFWGWFILAHLVGDAGDPSRPLVVYDYVLLSALAASLGGLALAWKWEFLGGALTLAAVAIGAFINWRVLLFPGTLIPIAAALFIASWWTRRRSAPNQGPLFFVEPASGSSLKSPV
jgi:hypothetical protein